MISQAYLLAWKRQAPWASGVYIEQDLLISRAVVAIFSDDFLREHLAFRGGTALHKLYLQPAPRYSEDIDLVQVKPGPIGPIMKRLREVIDFFEEPRKTKIGGHGAKAFYWFTTEYEQVRARVKVEINDKEHFNVLPWVDFPFRVENTWFTGEAVIRTYNINELLGTKLRALYQRSKGRDLFDLDYAYRHLDLDYSQILDCFRKYITFSTGNRPPSQAEFLINLEEKEKDPIFMGDMEAILRPEVVYDPVKAMAWVKKEIILKL